MKMHTRLPDYPGLFAPQRPPELKISPTQSKPLTQRRRVAETQGGRDAEQKQMRYDPDGGQECPNGWSEDGWQDDLTHPKTDGHRVSAQHELTQLDAKEGFGKD